MTDTIFDADKHTQDARKRWDTVSAAWYSWTPKVNQWHSEATELMLDYAGLAPGDSVLDIAAGAGGQSVLAAEIVGRTGSVLATDLSPEILKTAERFASEAGIENLKTQVMNAENLDLPNNSFDAVISRLGLMLLPDPDKCLREVYRVLKTGGRYACVVFTCPENNPYMTITKEIFNRHTNTPPPKPGEPDTNRFCQAGSLEQTIKGAGFRSVSVKVLKYQLRMDSVEEAVRFREEVFAGRKENYANLSGSARTALWNEIRSALEQFETPDGFVAPGEVQVGVGLK